MLRRLPTALAISQDDIQAFESHLAHRLALARFHKTGEDPDGRFTGTGTDTGSAGGGGTRRRENKTAVVVVDPSDELKPLPGDKARIVRSREERIMGGGAAR